MFLHSKVLSFFVIKRCFTYTILPPPHLSFCPYEVAEIGNVHFENEDLEYFHRNLFHLFTRY